MLVFSIDCLLYNFADRIFWALVCEGFLNNPVGLITNEDSFKVEVFVLEFVFGHKYFDELLIIDSVLVNIHIGPGVYAFGFFADAN